MTQPIRRRRGLTEQAAAAAIDTACRQLRLPTVRDLVTDLVTVAEKEQLTYQGFLAELLLAECDDRTRRRSVRRVKAAGFPRDKWPADFDSTPTRTSTRPPSTPWPAAAGSAPGNRCA
jgi:IstB-like ATP binding protein